MSKYHLSETAKEDLYRIYKYGLERFGMKQADLYFFAFFERFEQIANQPFLFPEVAEIREGYRRCPCGKDSIYYKLNREFVEIIRILGHQDVEGLRE